MSWELMLRRLAAANWEIVGAQRDARSTLPAALARYHEPSADYLRFVGSIEKCVHPSGDSWFLGLQDFAGTTDSAFSWDEFEKQSLEASKGDDSWQKEIRRFWDKVLPIAISVRSGYAYLGLCMDSADFGAVVLGREPEFEEITPVVPSFQELCRAVSAHLDGYEQPSLRDFL
jgi:hypothetical protein